jgi:transcriptional regulator with XRE-family HTH domain
MPDCRNVLLEIVTLNGYNVSMSKRSINKDLLKKRVSEMGIATIAVKAGRSPSLIQKLMSESYQGTPSIETVDGLCEATGDKIDVLFPRRKEKSIAS